MSQNAINNHIASSDFSVNNSEAGNEAIMKVSQSDTTNTGSNAVFSAETGGEGGGDPMMRFSVKGADSFTVGVNNRFEDTFTIASGNGFHTGSNQLVLLSKQGRLEAPHMPRFLYAETDGDNLTGNGEEASPVVFSIRYLDRSNPDDFDPERGIFTAPFAGTYFFQMQMTLAGITAQHTVIHYGFETRRRGSMGAHAYISSCGTKNTATTKPFGNIAKTVLATAGVISVEKFQLLPLNEGDTVRVVLQVRGGTKTVGLFDRRPATATDYTYFSGVLLI